MGQQDIPFDLRDLIGSEVTVWKDTETTAKISVMPRGIRPSGRARGNLDWDIDTDCSFFKSVPPSVVNRIVSHLYEFSSGADIWYTLPVDDVHVAGRTVLLTVRLLDDEPVMWRFEDDGSPGPGDAMLSHLVEETGAADVVDMVGERISVAVYKSVPADPDRPYAADDTNVWVIGPPEPTDEDITPPIVTRLVKSVKRLFSRKKIDTGVVTKEYPP